MQYLNDFELKDKNILLRLDLNTPISNGEVSSDERIVRSLPTIDYILKNQGRLTIISHLGRPNENGKIQLEFSLAPVAKRLGELLKREVSLLNNLEDHKMPLSGDLIMLENVRFLIGEKQNDEALSRKLAGICDIFIMDAFATSHRAHSSTTGVISYVDKACGGLLLKEELTSLNKLNQESSQPSVAVLGGAKISTKLDLINSLANKMDYIILGGGIANTCFASKGFEIGLSLYEESMLDQALTLANKPNVILPSHVVVSENKSSRSKIVDVRSIGLNEAIFDIAPKSFSFIGPILKQAKIILWNGPLGLFEEDKFLSGTALIADLIVNSDGYSVCGGGDTIAAAKKIGVLESIDYVSTAGGAFLEYIEGRKLPALEALKLKALNQK